MALFMGIIDPPGPFDPPADWAAFIKQLETLPSSPEVEAAIAEAKPFAGEPEESVEDDLEDLAEIDDAF